MIKVDNKTVANSSVNEGLDTKLNRQSTNALTNAKSTIELNKKVQTTNEIIGINEKVDEEILNKTTNGVNIPNANSYKEHTDIALFDYKQNETNIKNYNRDYQSSITTAGSLTLSGNTLSSSNYNNYGMNETQYNANAGSVTHYFTQKAWSLQGWCNQALTATDTLNVTPNSGIQSYYPENTLLELNIVNGLKLSGNSLTVHFTNGIIPDLPVKVYLPYSYKLTDKIPVLASTAFTIYGDYNLASTYRLMNYNTGVLQDIGDRGLLIGTETPIKLVKKSDYWLLLPGLPLCRGYLCFESDTTWRGSFYLDSSFNLIYNFIWPRQSTSTEKTRIGLPGLGSEETIHRMENGIINPYGLNTSTGMRVGLTSFIDGYSNSSLSYQPGLNIFSSEKLESIIDVGMQNYSNVAYGLMGHIEVNL